jgi:hypothetical protein
MARKPKIPKNDVLQQHQKESDDDSSSSSSDNNNNRRTARRRNANAPVEEGKHDSDHEEDLNVNETSHNKKRRRRREGIRLPTTRKERNKRSSHVTVDPKYVEKHMAFCCSICTCSEELKREIITNRRYDVRPAKKCLYHRRCCHHVRTITGWLDPLSNALQKVLPETDEDYEKVGQIIPEATLVLYQDLLKQYKTAKKLESETYNNDSCAGTFLQRF